MSKNILRTINLYKKYSDDYVLNNINISIKEGDIYGLIGLNGAGKSSLIRLITGLTAPTNGSIELFDGKSQNLSIRKRMGAIVESPALIPSMTASENLEVHRLVKGIPGKESIKHKLSLVGLKDTKRKKVKQFSLGMKQRLGLALALLGDPELLILDEPTNGLDPVGVIEFRELIKKLNRERGITILISSHMLSELSQLANRFGILHKGRLVEEISIKELNEKCKQHLLIKVDNVNRAATILENELKTNEFEVKHDGTIKLYALLDEVRQVSQSLTNNGLIIEQMTPMGKDLESYFTSIVGSSNNG
ncbi:ABC transporter ATP-binding protein [Fictibacillus barbaricus]|uniref:ATP-binding cassette domain-containing protein n=1 Tax=Fictibacillus barbaricus TaxID=182136 RepID=A0ABS2ZBK5_9BACL|nr:ATP-binding cassette domain-containing protein [Fictibacillus barbaricus]MBN3544115.1 ATP-binding cassette domain-containing protein [Fictibacillus barbaricus]GGB69060.1 bacitracin ABC transporter ATP-binding protein [Fictibacillus barbaricus]